MLPTAITVRNYRSFAGPQRFELRPLTLIYGKNNKGKSALLRCLPLIADSLAATGLDALSYEGSEGRLSSLDLSFDSLRWKGRLDIDEPTIGVKLHFDDQEFTGTIDWAIRELPDWKRVLTEELIVEEGQGRLLEARLKLTKREARAQALSYEIIGPGQKTGRIENVSFQGLAPDLRALLPEQGPLISARLQKLSNSVLWLRSLRQAPRRFTRWSGSVRWSLKPDGSDAPVVLVGEPEVREDVSRFYADKLGHDLIVEEPRTNEVRVSLRKRTAAGFDVDLIDTGEGLAQILPVLTALAMARQHERRGGAEVVAIEDPETHLHDDLRRALALEICKVAAQSRPRIVLETHSQAFLLSVVLASLNGDIPRDDVLIYWVRQREDGRSEAEPITLDELGRFEGGWPPDAFQEDLKLSADIQDRRDALEGQS